jgi:hypothetical protein
MANTAQARKRARQSENNRVRNAGQRRDMLFARLFGADSGTDAFFVAFKIPNFLRRLFAEGAFAQAFVPVLSDYKEQGGKAALRYFIDRTAGTLALILMLTTIIGMLAAPWREPDRCRNQADIKKHRSKRWNCKFTKGI